MAQQPTYQKIAEDLRRRIDLGAAFVPGRDDDPEALGPASGSPMPLKPGGQLPAVLKPGSQLPTELELCDAYAASRNTIRDAVRRLTGLNLVETRPGQGTFVVRKVDPFVTILSSVPDPEATAVSIDPESAAYLSEVNKEHRQAAVSLPKVEMQVPHPEVALRLGLKPNAQAVSRHQERYIDDTPWSLQISFYPMEFIAKGATELLMARGIPGGAVRYLAATLGVRQVGQRDWITMRNPDENEQKFFELAQDATVFVIYRTGFDQNKKPMRVTVTIYRADRNQFIVDSGDVPDPQYAVGDLAATPGPGRRAFLVLWCRRLFPADLTARVSPLGVVPTETAVSLPWPVVQAPQCDHREHPQQHSEAEEGGYDACHQLEGVHRSGP